MYLLIILLTKIISIAPINIQCDAETSKIKLTVSVINKRNATVTGLSLAVRGSNQDSPWVKQSNCQNTNEKLECPRKDMNNAQYLKLRTTLLEDSITNDVNNSLWLYDCYKQHGVHAINITKNTWQGFSLKWSHYPWDNLFKKTKEVIRVKNKSTKKIYTGVVLNNSYSFNDVNIDYTYEACVTTTFAPHIKFVRDREVEKCISLTTPKNPNPKKESSFKKPLMAIGIGIIVLITLFIVFIIYHKKCKQGGDHDYDMNKKEEEDVEENGVELVHAEHSKDNETLLESKNTLHENITIEK